MLSGYNHAIEKLENTSGGAGFIFLIALVGECKSFLSEQRNYPSVLFFFLLFTLKRGHKVQQCRSRTLQSGRSQKRGRKLMEAEPSFNRRSLPKKLCQPPVLKCFHHNDRREDVFSVWIMSGDKILTSVNTAQRMKVFQRGKYRQTECRCGTPEGRIPLRSPSRTRGN